jgi:diguanylate cyclase (GGDEF)-like protein
MRVGAVIFFAACCNDLLIDLARLDLHRLLPYGFIAVTLAMAVSLANRLTSMFGQLEAEVAERTEDLLQANRQLEEASRVDPLTGVLNRRGFQAEAEGEIRRHNRSGRSLSIVLADIDQFKRFNDSHGHACGDQVLQQVATLLCQHVRDVDHVGRWGGEEFIMLLPETSDEGATILAEKLRAQVEAEVVKHEDGEYRITMTLGIAVHRRGETLDACIARADTALYAGKERGRNRVMIGSYKGLTVVN